MAEKLNIENFLYQSENLNIIDVRSPSEYAKGHIPGAINIPLFSDEERAIIGTLYKKKGRKEAIQKGFLLISAKYSQLADSGITHTKENKLFLYCWRGGMRSASMAWLFEQQGIRCFLLEGGYKSYRLLIRSYLKNKMKLLVLGGKTGTGKTKILKELEKKGEQIIDLEKIACHKGSAFGSLGEIAQPTTEQFENLLLEAVLKLDLNKRIWIEDESRNIGRIIIPVELFQQMRESHVVFLDMDIKMRVLLLIDEYGKFRDSELIESFEKITKKLGGLSTQISISSVKNGDYKTATEIALQYYDKTYQYGLSRRDQKNIHVVQVTEPDPSANAALLIDYLSNSNNHNLSKIIS